MLNVTIDAEGLNQEEASEWVEELVNVYADMEIEDVNIKGEQITFKAGFSGMDDTSAYDIKMRLDEYLTMNEAFSVTQAGPIVTEPIPPPR
jgi:hypothetical protein